MATITGISPTVATGDTSLVTPFPNATLSDPGGTSYYDLYVVQQQAGNGILIDPAGTANYAVSNDGLLFGIGATGSSLTPAQVLQADQSALRSLEFQPTAAQVAPGQSVTTGLSVELIRTGSSTGVPATAAVTNVVATAVANPLAIQVPPPPTFQAIPGTSYAPFSAYKLVDGRAGAQDTTAVTLTVGGSPSDAAGTLSGAGLTKTGAGTYTLAAASPAAEQQALQALQFTPAIPSSGTATKVTFGLSLSNGAGLPATAQSTVSFGSLAGGAVTTNSFTQNVTTNTTATSQTVQAYSTTIDASLGPNTVYAQTFALPYSDPAVQAAVTQADQALVSADATPGSPALSVSATTGTTTTATTPASLTFASTVGDTTTVFGPATEVDALSASAGLTDNFLVLSGQLGIVLPSTIDYTNDQTATTTTTDTLAQTYTITGIPNGGGPVTPPGTAMPEPASAAVMWVALAGSVLARRARLRARRARTAGGKVG